MKIVIIKGKKKQKKKSRRSVGKKLMQELKKVYITRKK